MTLRQLGRDGALVDYVPTYLVGKGPASPPSRIRFRIHGAWASRGPALPPSRSSLAVPSYWSWGPEHGGRSNSQLHAAQFYTVPTRARAEFASTLQSFTSIIVETPTNTTSASGIMGLGLFPLAWRQSLSPCFFPPSPSLCPTCSVLSPRFFPSSNLLSCRLLP